MLLGVTYLDDRASMDTKTSTPTLSPLQQYLEELYFDLRHSRKGEVASYIPQLSRVDPDWFGITIATVDGHVYQVGDSQQKFTIQSISKAFVYGLALEDNGLEKVAERVDVEPSGESFNSFSVEANTGRPLNPMINAGAIAVTAMVKGKTPDEKIRRIIECFVRYTGHGLKIDEDVSRSEKETGDRNRAIAYLLNSFSILDNPPEASLDVYFQQCSINVTCRDLAVMGACLANNGVNPVTGVRTLKTEYVPKVLSVMGTCGMYDYSGNWVYTVGMPAKSGVAGGIVAVLPGQLGLAVYSPRLDERGNSILGIKVCEKISADFSLHLYHSVRATASSVIRRSYQVSQVQSKKLRRQSDVAYLEASGHEIRVFQLQGDLMFGSTESVLKSVLDILPDTNYVVLDLQHVFEIDPAACQLLLKLKELVRAQGKTLIFTNTSYKYAFTRYLSQSSDGQHDGMMFRFEDTDHALEWCEDQLLARSSGGSGQAIRVELADQDLCRGLDGEHIELLQVIAKRVTYEEDVFVFRCGDVAESFFLIHEGEAEVLLPTESGRRKRLAVLSPGMSFGEMALLNHRIRSADVRTSKNCSLYEIVFDEIPEAVRINLVTNFAEQLARTLGRETRERQHLE